MQWRMGGKVRQRENASAGDCDLLPEIQKPANERKVMSVLRFASRMAPKSEFSLGRRNRAVPTAKGGCAGRKKLGCRCERERVELRSQHARASLHSLTLAATNGRLLRGAS